MKRTFALLVLCTLGGCGYKVQLSSAPAPAEVRLPNGETVFTPAEVKFRYIPFERQKIVVSADGYRTVELDLRKDEIKAVRYISDALFHPGTFFGKPRGEVRVVMVPAHGPSGTWGVEEIPD